MQWEVRELEALTGPCLAAAGVPEWGCHQWEVDVTPAAWVICGAAEVVSTVVAVVVAVAVAGGGASVSVRTAAALAAAVRTAERHYPRW